MNLIVFSFSSHLIEDYGSNPKRNLPRKERNDVPTESPAAHILMRESTILEFLKTPPRRNSPVSQPFKPVQPSDPGFKRENRRLDVSSNPVRQPRDIDVAELNRISSISKANQNPQTYTRARKMTTPTKDINRFTFLSDRAFDPNNNNNNMGMLSKIGCDLN